MQEFKSGHITVEFHNFDHCEITDDMVQSAIKYAECHKENKAFVIDKVKVSKKDDKAVFDVEYKDEDQPKIGRIRRITGYLTGTTDRWNNAKRAELRDRVNHIGCACNN